MSSKRMRDGGDRNKGAKRPFQQLTPTPTGNDIHFIKALDQMSGLFRTDHQQAEWKKKLNNIRRDWHPDKHIITGIDKATATEVSKMVNHLCNQFNEAKSPPDDNTNLGEGYTSYPYYFHGDIRLSGFRFKNTASFVDLYEDDDDDDDDDLHSARQEKQRRERAARRPATPPRPRAPGSYGGEQRSGPGSSSSSSSASATAAAACGGGGAAATHNTSSSQSGHSFVNTNQRRASFGASSSAAAPQAEDEPLHAASAAEKACRSEQQVPSTPPQPQAAAASARPPPPAAPEHKDTPAQPPPPPSMSSDSKRSQKSSAKAAFAAPKLRDDDPAWKGEGQKEAEERMKVALRLGIEIADHEDDVYRRLCTALGGRAINKLTPGESRDCGYLAMGISGIASSLMDVQNRVDVLMCLRKLLKATGVAVKQLEGTEAQLQHLISGVEINKAKSLEVTTPQHHEWTRKLPSGEVITSTGYLINESRLSTMEREAILLSCVSKEFRDELTAHNHCEQFTCHICARQVSGQEDDRANPADVNDTKEEMEGKDNDGENDPEATEDDNDEEEEDKPARPAAASGSSSSSSRTSVYDIPSSKSKGRGLANKCGVVFLPDSRCAEKKQHQPNKQRVDAVPNLAQWCEDHCVRNVNDRGLMVYRWDAYPWLHPYLKKKFPREAGKMHDLSKFLRSYFCSRSVGNLHGTWYNNISLTIDERAEFEAWAPTRGFPKKASKKGKGK